MSSYLYHKRSITQVLCCWWKTINALLLLNTTAQWARFRGSSNGKASECKITKSAKRLKVPKGHGKSNLELSVLLFWELKKHMGPEDPTNREKKYPSFFLKPKFRKLQDDSKNVSLEIGSTSPQKLGPFFSLFLMRKTLSSGRKWFLRPYFPLIKGMFLLRSGLRFSFRALEVPQPRVRKRPF